MQGALLSYMSAAFSVHTCARALDASESSCVFLHACVNVCLLVCKFQCESICMYICIHGSAFVFMRVRARVSVYVRRERFCVYLLI